MANKILAFNILSQIVLASVENQKSTESIFLEKDKCCLSERLLFATMEQKL